MSNKVKLSKFEKWFKTLHRFEKVVYRFCFPYKKYGHTKPYDDRAYIFVGNHYSIFDAVPAACATTKPVHFLAKSNLWTGSSLMRKFVEKCQCVRVNRDGNDVRAVMQAMRYLKNGEHIGIFPEGTRNKNFDDFLPFKGGATAISIKTKTPIVPILQVKKIKFWRKSHIYYGEPIEFPEFYDKKLTEEDIVYCETKLRDVMWDLRAKFIDYLKLPKKQRKLLKDKIC